MWANGLTDERFLRLVLEEGVAAVRRSVEKACHTPGPGVWPKGKSPRNSSLPLKTGPCGTPSGLTAIHPGLAQGFAKQHEAWARDAGSGNRLRQPLQRAGDHAFVVAADV